MNATRSLLTAFTAFLLSACSAPRRNFSFQISPGDPPTGKLARRDYSQYTHVPDTPTNLIYRAILKTVPCTRHKAFWGRWAGSGCASGPPVDDMDEIFRRHDIVYGEARSLHTMQWADAACVAALRRLDTRRMSAEALAYRDRSIAFFSNPRLTLVGKPVSSWFISREDPGCPVMTEREVWEVFGLQPPSRDGLRTPASRHH